VLQNVRTRFSALISHGIKKASIVGLELWRYLIDPDYLLPYRKKFHWGAATLVHCIQHLLLSKALLEREKGKDVPYSKHEAKCFVNPLTAHSHE
jgi:hypothetical protein